MVKNVKTQLKLANIGLIHIDSIDHIPTAAVSRSYFRVTRRARPPKAINGTVGPTTVDPAAVRGRTVKPRFRKDSRCGDFRTERF